MKTRFKPEEDRAERLSKALGDVQPLYSGVSHFKTMPEYIAWLSRLCKTVEDILYEDYGIDASAIPLLNWPEEDCHGLMVTGKIPVNPENFGADELEVVLGRKTAKGGRLLRASEGLEDFLDWLDGVAEEYERIEKHL